MKNILLFVGLFLTSSTLLADGLEQYMEISFLLNGERKTAFIPCNISAEEEITFIENRLAFEEYFSNKFNREDIIEYNNSIIDYGLYRNYTKVPLPAFAFSKSSKRELPRSFFLKVELIQIWSRSDYFSQILTPLSPEDTAWLKKEFSKILTVGEDVGCRLEIYQFKRSLDITEEINILTKEYSAENGYMKSTPFYVKEAILELKRKKVLVIERCGC